jgi:hypothetical protein
MKRFALSDDPGKTFSPHARLNFRPLIMWENLLWIYLLTASLMIVHEMDSAYWKEWELFHLPGGIGFFLIIHIPLVFLIMWGALMIERQESAGLMLAVLLAAGGLIAFFLHSFFLAKGHTQFKAPVSVLILVLGLISSVIQAYLALKIYTLQL